MTTGQGGGSSSPGRPTHVRIDSAYLRRVDPALEVSTVHPVDDHMPGTLWEPARYLVRGHWLSGYHVSRTAAPKVPDDLRALLADRAQTWFDEAAKLRGNRTTNDSPLDEINDSMADVYDDAAQTLTHLLDITKEN